MNVRRLLEHELVRAGMQSYAFSSLTLAANLITGIITARALGPEGRGVTVAVAMLALNLGLIFALGVSQAVSYRFAKEPGTGGRLLTVWAGLLLALGLVAIAIGQLALPVVFDAQGADTIELGRVYLFMVLVVLWTELTNGVLLGAGEYLFVSAARFAQPGLIAAIQIVLWALDELTVDTVLLTWAGASVLVQLVALRRVWRVTGGPARFDRVLARETFSYGLRGQGVALAGALNTRLDLLILPAFVASASLGLYSIAANVSLIVHSVANSFSALLVPAAVREGERGPAAVLRSLQAVLGIAAVAGLLLFVFARPALELVYGEEFGDATEALRLLLPGTVLLAGASILNAGLYAANRPGLATITQVLGLAVTVAGLLIFLPSGGIRAAAIVSTTAYAVVFAAALVNYRRLLGAPR